MTRFIGCLLGSAFVLGLLSSLAATAEPQKPKDEPRPGDNMIEAYLAAETDKLSKKELDGATTLDEWKQRRPRLHREYMDMLGLWPLPEKTPLHATITGSLERDGVVIDKLHFQSKPGLYVTGNLYRPRGNTKKLPTILYVCGHANKGRDGNKSEYQDHGRWFASNGYNCLVLDSLQLGEIPGVHHGTYGRPYNHLAAYSLKDKDVVENRWWWQSRGYTPAGVECWNGIRAIDYLVSRADVDAGRIGVTGISGGGAATFWIAAADERVQVAVPVSGMSDLESYVKNKVVNGHCDCMFLYNTYQWEWTTIAALVAPRPLLFANSDHDPIFPMDGNRRIFGRLTKLYKMYGKENLVEEYVSQGGHAYRPDLRVAIFKFINKHLKNDAITPVKDAAFERIPGNELRVFPTNADIPKNALNDRIDETFVPQAVVKLPEKGKFAEWQRSLIEELRDKSFRRFPNAIPDGKSAPDQFRKVFGSERPESWVEAIIETTQGICVPLFLKLKKKTTHPKTGLLLVAGPEENEVGPPRSPWPLEGWAFPLRKGAEEKKVERPTWIEPFEYKVDLTLSVSPRGVGRRSWSTKSPPNYVERSHVLVGDTVDEGKVWDVIATAGYLRKSKRFGKYRWSVIGRGPSGIIAVYAALFDPNIEEVILIDPPKSHRDGPTFLNVLRVLDVPEALGLLAPRRLTLINARDPAFDRTAEIYRLAGAAAQLTRK